MSKDETFDEFRLRREIERMEQEFRERAGVQRERVEELLAGEEKTEEIERRVESEMEDFLSDSTSAAERVLERYAGGSEKAGKAQEELRTKLRSFITDIHPTALDESGAPEPAGKPEQAAPPAAPELDVERRPLGVVSQSPKPRDLRSALRKLQKRSPEEAPGGVDDTATFETANRGRTRGHILDKFDSALNQFSDILATNAGEDPAQAGMGDGQPAAGDDSRGRGPGAALDSIQVSESSLPPISDHWGGGGGSSRLSGAPGGVQEEPADESDFRPPSGLTTGAPPPAPTMNAPPPPVETAPPPPARTAPPPPVSSPPSPAERGAPPMGATNVYESDPEEDVDIDEKLEIADPEGWDLPSGPEAPGAWVVARQKEEGESGLSGIAGDSYLMKKLCQEVRHLNRLYLTLLEKNVVTRGEVEGPEGGVPRPSGGDDSDDDVVSVEDFEEERYRPILASDQDFSLSGLVADVHRLKTLREVLIKKKVVSEKELKKAESK